VSAFLDPQTEACPPRPWTGTQRSRTPDCSRMVGHSEVELVQAGRRTEREKFNPPGSRRTDQFTI